MKSILDFKTHTINLHGKRTRQCGTAMPGNEVPGSEDIEKIMAYQKIVLAHWFGNVLQMILSYF